MSSAFPIAVRFAEVPTYIRRFSVASTAGQSSRSRRSLQQESFSSRLGWRLWAGISSQGWPLSGSQERHGAAGELSVGKAVLQPRVLAQGCRMRPQSHHPLKQTPLALSFQSAASDPENV